MKTIYKTKGAAKEYCELAVDIYNNCPHKCEYCYAKAKEERKNKDFCFGGARENIIEETENYLKSNKDIYGKTIFLGFSSDPIPKDEDVTKTLEMVKLLKKYNCNIMFCTKGYLANDTIKEIIKLSDSVGITISCNDEMAIKYEKYAALPSERIKLLKYAKENGCETWISFEPILDDKYIISLLESNLMDYVDIVKIGKLNHMELSNLTKNDNDFIDWKEFGLKAIEICERKGQKYIIKDALKKLL